VKEGRFLNSALYGKRLVLYPDCKNSKVGMTEFIRNCTSGDPVTVEFKGQTPFSSRFRVKLFVASNPKPEITGQKADSSRMIYIEVSPSKNIDDPTWSKRLENELPAFLHACKQKYQQVCPHGGDIQLSTKSQELRDEAAGAFEERYHEIFDSNFQAVSGQLMPAGDLSRRLRGLGFNNNEIADFKAWMERTHGVRTRRTNSGRFYEGIKFA
jgi:hypothetical protein